MHGSEVCGKDESIKLEVYLLEAAEPDQQKWSVK